MKKHTIFHNQVDSNPPLEQPKNFTIRLLSYNIFLRPPPIKNNISDYKDARCQEFLQYINDYDIICLQEVFGFLNKRKHKIVKTCFKSGFHFYASSISPSFFSTFLVDGGLLTLSKFPIVATEFVTYKYCILTDSLSNKGVLYTKILIKDQVLHLFNTHTQASYMGKLSDRKASVKTRIDQFYELRSFIEVMLKKYGFEENHLVLITADFNVDARNSIHPIEFVKGYLNVDQLKNKEVYNEYEFMLEVLIGSKDDKDKIFDILKLKTGDDRPATYGCVAINDKGEKIPGETALTLEEDLMSDQSLDYILHLIPKGIYDGFDNIPSRSSILEVQYPSIKVEKFLIENRPFTQLSDHFGLSLQISYKQGGETDHGYESSIIKMNNQNFEVSVNPENNESIDATIINIIKDEI